MLTKENITALRMERQFLSYKAKEQEYCELYRDTQPGQNVYWNGFGDPPSITFRGDFNDIEYNRQRQKERKLIKGRFQGGNVGWIVQEDLELFAALAIKPLDKPTALQQTILELIQREGPMNIGLMKEMTGLLVKEITPALHRLQEAFLIYEDQYDGEWDRAWYKFSEMFPEVNLQKYTRSEALKIVLRRFAFRNVLINADMVKSFYKLTNKDIKIALSELVSEKVLIPYEDFFMLETDIPLLSNNTYETPKSVYVMHRNDFLVKSNEYWLKEKYKQSDADILQYILIDGKFQGVVAGKFKNGPYIIEDIVLHISDAEKQSRKEEIIEAVYEVNNREHSAIKRYCGEMI
jgi:hypothetical protein